MFRNIIASLLFFVASFFNFGKIEAALQRGDIVYRTSKAGDMYGKNSWNPLRPGHNGIYVGEIKSYGDDEHLYYVVEALGWDFTYEKVMLNLLSEFVDSSEGQEYLGAKTSNVTLDSKRRDNIIQIALDQVGEGYDNDFSDQKGPDCNQWTCVGLTEKAYESADTPDVLQYASCNGTVSSDCYGTGSTNYALDITPDGIDYNNIFTTTMEMSDVAWFKGVTKKIFFPYTQYLQYTKLKNVTTDLPVSNNFSHALISPGSCETEVSQGGFFGPFTIEESNTSSSYYAFYVQSYVIKPDGTTVNFKQVSTGLKAGETRKHSHYLSIPSWSELGTFTYGVKVTDTKENLIDDDSFEFTVVSSSSSSSINKKSARKLKRLMRKSDTQVLEEGGWHTVIVPEQYK